MPEYLAPGVYVEEVSSGNKPIAGVSTSTAGFVGATERGPLEPRFISNWLEFQRWYGGYLGDDAYLAYAVEGFFANGGQRCFVARVVGDAAAYANGRLGDSINVVAVGPGAWGSKIEVTATYATRAVQAWRTRAQTDPTTKASPLEKCFKVTVEYKKNGKVKASEVYDDLSHEPGAANNAVNTINASSHLIRVWWNDQEPQPPNLDPITNQNLDDVEDDTAQPPKKTLPTMRVTWAPGADSDPQVKHFIGVNKVTMPALPLPDGATARAPADLLGQPGQPLGLAALELIDEISLLVVPDEVNPKVEKDARIRRQITSAVIEQCAKLNDRFALVSVDRGKSNPADLQPPLESNNGAFYYPWIKVFDPSIEELRPVPPTGHIAGIFARTDIERGVHKAPANAVVRGAIDLEFPVTKTMQDMLNPRGVNCIRDFRSDGRGIRLWGARTMSSDPEWRYVNVRRLFLFVEESLDEGTRWVVFEPNDESTWAAVRRNVTSFLIGVWRSGALMGLTPDEAFFVACDRTTMTQDDIDNGHLICVIGIAPVKPAEFVIFHISQKTAEAGR